MEVTPATRERLKDIRISVERLSLTISENSFSKKTIEWRKEDPSVLWICAYGYTSGILQGYEGVPYKLKRWTNETHCEDFWISRFEGGHESLEISLPERVGEYTPLGIECSKIRDGVKLFYGDLF